MTTWLQDLRYAVRNLLKARGLTVAALLTLTLGIGANTAIFSIIDAVLLRPLPFRDPDQLVRLNETEAAPGRYPFAGPDFVDWKAQNKTFQDMTLFAWPSDMNLSGDGEPAHVIGVPTAANFFSLLGVPPLLGRTFAPGEDQPGKSQVAVLTYGLWMERYAGDPGVVGRTIELNSEKHTIIGVMPPVFRYPARPQLWVPLELDTKGLGERGRHWLNAIGRLKPGVTPAMALADLQVIARRLEQTYPKSNDKIGAALKSLRDDLVGDSRESLLLVLSAVGLVLLIACANVANLLLSRAVSRQKEMAVRSALGASRGRLLAQLLTESLVLSAAGGALGLAVAFLLIRAFAGARFVAVPAFAVIRLNGEVLAFAAALAVVTGLLFGLFPAFRTSRPDVHDELKGGAGSSVSPGRRRRFTSNALVVGEMAISLLLLFSAGLLLKDLARLRSLDIGVRTQGVLTAGVRLPEAGYKESAERWAFAQALEQKAAAIPGVETVALSSHLPLEGGSNYYISIRGRAGSRDNALVETHAVSPSYFRAMGIRLLEGRLLTSEDVRLAVALDARWAKLRKDGLRMPPAEADATITPTVINESMARHFWPGQSPLGAMFSGGNSGGPWRQVIGVVSDVRQWGLTQRPIPEAYDPFPGDSRFFLVLHTAGRPTALTTAVRAALASLDGRLPLFSVRTMDQVIGDNSQGQQFFSLLVGSFALTALLLAAIGIYGVLSYSVTQRTREIGIRMSLGASRVRVMRDVIGQGIQLALLGFVIGIAGALAAGRLLAAFLHEVKPGDPWVVMATAALLAAVAVFACYLPARRASRLEPTTALRYE